MHILKYDCISNELIYLILQITHIALRNMKIERSIDEIMKNIDRLSNHLNTYKDIHNSLGKTMDNSSLSF